MFLRTYLKLLGFILLIHSPKVAAADINLQGQSPQTIFSSMRHDFGTIYQGQMVAHKFKFQNTGNGTLILTSLHASCGCVNARTLSENGVTPKHIFKPGEKGIVSVEFDSAQFAGPIVRTITIETNANIRSQTMTLSLIANVKQEISATPAMLYLGTVQKNEARSLSVKLNLKQKDLKILNVKSDLPFVNAEIIKSSQSSDEVVLSVKIPKTESLPIGPFQGTLIVENTSEFHKNFKIPVMGEVRGHVKASTKFLEFGVVNQNDTSDRTILFQSNNPDFSITRIKIDLNNALNFEDLSESDLFDIQQKQTNIQQNGEDLYQQTLKLVLKYPSANQFKSSDALLSGLNISGNFLIETNDADYPQIRVPFFGILKQE